MEEETKVLKLKVGDKVSFEIPENFINKLSINSIMGLFFIIGNLYATGFLLLFAEFGISRLNSYNIFILISSSIALSIAILIVTMVLGIFIADLKLNFWMTFLFWANMPIFGILIAVTGVLEFAIKQFTNYPLTFIQVFFLTSIIMTIITKIVTKIFRINFSTEIQYEKKPSSDLKKQS